MFTDVTSRSQGFSHRPPRGRGGVKSAGPWLCSQPAIGIPAAEHEKVARNQLRCAELGGCVGRPGRPRVSPSEHCNAIRATSSALRARWARFRAKVWGASSSSSPLRAAIWPSNRSSARISRESASKQFVIVVPLKVFFPSWAMPQQASRGRRRKFEASFFRLHAAFPTFQASPSRIAFGSMFVDVVSCVNLLDLGTLRLPATRGRVIHTIAIEVCQ